MTEFTEQQLLHLEHEVEVAEHKLARQLTDAEADAIDVADTLREVLTRLEAEHQAGATSLAPLVATLRQVAPPTVPHEQHRLRSAEVRADALRARKWLVSSMAEDLRRFTFELADLVKLAEEARAALQKLADQPRVNHRPRLDRIRSVTGDFAEAVARPDPSATAPRRKRPRVRLEASIDLHSRSNFYTGFTENISDGGIFIASNEELPVGTEVELVFSLPSGQEIRGRGVVRWYREHSADSAAGLGVQFEGLSGEAREAIQRFIDAREPIFHPD